MTGKLKKIFIPSALCMLAAVLTLVLPSAGLAQDEGELKIPATVLIEGGSFTMGMDVMVDAESAASTTDTFTGATPFKEGPAHQVKMSTFYIGQYEVTNEEYAEFIDAGGYENRDYWLIDPEYGEEAETGWNWKQKEGRTAPLYKNYTTQEDDGWNLSADPYWMNDSYSGQADTPVVGVSWYEAYAYCKWLSEVTGETYRLPTEAEWEYAGRGPKNYIFPWGNKYLSAAEMCGEPGSGAMANCWLKDDQIEMKTAGAGGGGSYSALMETGMDGLTTPVGSYPEGVSYSGCYDMAGNVMEWTADWFKILYYPYRVRNGLVEDPAGPAMGYPFIIPVPPFWLDPCRAIRSQGFIQDSIGDENYSMFGPTYPLRCAHRQFVKRYGGTFYIGFRVLKEAR